MMNERVKISVLWLISICCLIIANMLIFKGDRLFVGLTDISIMFNYLNCVIGAFLGIIGLCSLFAVVTFGKEMYDNSGAILNMLVAFALVISYIPSIIHIFKSIIS